MASQFNETQKFRQWWILALLVIIGLVNIWGIIQQIILGIPFGNNPSSNLMLILIAVFYFLMMAFILSIRLMTKIDRETIAIRFFPFHRKMKKFKWYEIEKAYVRKYKPIREYGGWGIRIGFKGKAYNISGNMGLQLEFKNGKKILIGTAQPGKLEDFLKQLQSSKNPNFE
jgi:hypothetical protein